MFGIDPSRLRKVTEPPPNLLQGIAGNSIANIGRLALLNKEMGSPEFFQDGGAGGRPVPSPGF